MGDLKRPLIGIIGLGSIGKRHASELHTLGADIVALRRGRQPLAAGLPFVEEVTDAEAFCSRAPATVIIATPTSVHVESLQYVLQQMGCPILVEKPLAATLSEAETIASDAHPRIRVAYCLRFHPVVRMVNAVLAAGGLGELVGGSVRFGSYLPGWPFEGDVRNSYAARRDLGGGVLRTLSHELDLLQLWFGRVRCVRGTLAQVSGFVVDVEDMAHLSCVTDRDCPVTVSLDFLTNPSDRHGYLFGTHGSLRYSLTPSVVSISCQGRVEEKRVGGYDEMYSAQARDLLGWISGDGTEACPLRDALETLRLIELAEDQALKLTNMGWTS